MIHVNFITFSIIKYVKMHFYKFSPIDRNISEFFCVPLAWFINLIYTYIQTKHSVVHLNNIYQFQDVWRIFKRTTAYKTEGQIDRQLNWMHELYWTLLESVSNENSCASGSVSRLISVYFSFQKSILLSKC